jgi:nitroreductase
MMAAGPGGDIMDRDSFISAAGRQSVMDAIYGRRSVRSYTPRRLDRSVIGALLAAAVRAPTAVHAEPWAFAIVQDRDTLQRLSDRAKPLFLEEAHRAHLDRGGHTLEIFASPEFNIFYDAGTLIVICGTLAGPFVSRTAGSPRRI